MTKLNHIDNPVECAGSDVIVKDEFLRVDLINLDEGVCGDYNPDDPEDINLLRFDVYTMNPGFVKEDPNDMYYDGWDMVEDASYCTLLPADAPIEKLVKAAEIIFDRYREELDTDTMEFNCSPKKLGEELSWISLDNVKDIDIER